MPTTDPSSVSPHARLVSGLSQAQVTAFELTPGPKDRAAIAQELDFIELRKLRFVGEISAEGKRDWRLEGLLGATVVQPSVVTLEPVVTRIDVPVLRRYLARWDDVPEAGSETEMPDDDSLEPLGTHIDPWTVMLEALALAAPDFPRASETESLGSLSVTEPGKQALSDDDVKPFAGLAALKDKLSGESDS